MESENFLWLNFGPAHKRMCGTMQVRVCLFFDGLPPLLIIEKCVQTPQSSSSKCSVNGNGCRELTAPFCIFFMVACIALVACFGRVYVGKICSGINSQAG